MVLHELCRLIEAWDKMRQHCRRAVLLDLDLTQEEQPIEASA